MDIQEKRKRGEHVYIVDRNKSNIKKQTIFDDTGKKILNSFKIKPLIENFNKQDLKKRKYPEPIDLSCPLFKKNNFILSPKAIEKCNKVYHYMVYQIPCLLEGETGTSKSFTASMMAQYRQWKIIEEEKKFERAAKEKKENIQSSNFLNLV